METTSPPSSSPSSPFSTESCSISVVPTEIVSDDEMAFLENALASTRPLLSSSMLSSSPSRLPLVSSLPSAVSPARRHVTSIRSRPSSPVKDIEDSGKLPRPKSFLERFRAHKPLSVTDFTATEWCPKQKELELFHGKELELFHGKPEKTPAMEAGFNRHKELEQEVTEKIEIHIGSPEDYWAVKFLNFIVGTKQLLFEGLTRELPVIGVFGDTWIFGIIDEVRMPISEASANPFLVDTKTRYKPMLPTEAQKRNGRLQLMCYKYLWDGLVAGTFPTEYFFKYFKLNPQYILSEEINQYTASLGFDMKTFEDVVTCFRDSCFFLCPSHDNLLLRYELQSDRSLLGEHQFEYDDEWLRNQIEECLKFWSGEKEASYVSKAERWKCRFCKFNTKCLMPSESLPRARYGENAT